MRPASVTGRCDAGSHAGWRVAAPRIETRKAAGREGGITARVRASPPAAAKAGAMAHRVRPDRMLPPTEN